MRFEGVEGVESIAVFVQTGFDMAAYEGGDEGPVIGDGQAGVEVGEGGGCGRNGE